MGRLEEILNSGKTIFLSGPYGTEVMRRFGLDITKNQQALRNVPTNYHLGADGSALLTPQGREYLRQIALDYLDSVPSEETMVLVTPSFRLSYPNLHAASLEKAFNSALAGMGLDLCLDSINACKDALQQSKRHHENTFLSMTIGPPFDCYRGEDTPIDVDNRYLPQTFAAVRFGKEVDYIMFETVPSLKGALGAAKAFKTAHESLNISERIKYRQKAETVEYLGNTLDVSLRNKFNTDLVCPSYDIKSHTFSAIHPSKGYLIYFCVDEDGNLTEKDEHDKIVKIPFEDAVYQLYEKIDRQRLYSPIGIGISCNSPQLTGEVLGSLSSGTVKKIVGIHPNASSERNPKKYGELKKLQAIPAGEYVKLVSAITRGFNINIVGGCCATNQYTLKKLVHTLKS
ncbi:homocysteine S-methyltransferase family protein [Candidatus Woesearchaeota archaeon]|nr:homocysteine S-methyltransferase family protein [Candidatus Woesearchaeota archaeon]